MKLGSTNISTTTVANALQTSSHDVGTLCTHANINKWSKWKPVRYATNTGITEEQLKSVQFGLTAATHLTQSQMQGNSVVGWTYNKPLGGQNSPYRLGDFRNYNTDAQCPMQFGLGNPGVYSTTINTAATGVLPAIMVRYKLSDSIQSSGMAQVEIPIEEINMGTTVTDNLDNYLACVTYYRNGELYVANQEDTLGCKYGTPIDANIINLDYFNLDGAWADASDDDEHFPEGAKEKEVLKLIPRINMFTPASKGQVRRSAAGGPVTTHNLNGYYDSITNFLAVPECNTLTIYRYSKPYLRIDYIYCNVFDGRGFYAGSWGFIAANAPSDTQVQQLSGQTIHFSSTQVTMQLVADIYNDDDYDGYAKPNDVWGSIFPRGGVAKMYIGGFSGNDIMSTGVQIPANSHVRVYLEIAFPQGSKADWTFPDPTPPASAYGTEAIYSDWMYLRSSAWSAATTLEMVTPKMLRWR